MSERIVLKCDPHWLDQLVRLGSIHPETHDSVSAACYQQAIKEYDPNYKVNITDGNHSSTWIEQRAAELLAEKLR